MHCAATVWQLHEWAGPWNGQIFAQKNRDATMQLSSIVDQMKSIKNALNVYICFNFCLDFVTDNDIGLNDTAIA